MSRIFLILTYNDRICIKPRIPAQLGPNIHNFDFWPGFSTQGHDFLGNSEHFRAIFSQAQFPCFIINMAQILDSRSTFGIFFKNFRKKNSVTPWPPKNEGVKRWKNPLLFQSLTINKFGQHQSYSKVGVPFEHIWVVHLSHIIKIE